jgi:hypothetical protein
MNCTRIQHLAHRRTMPALSSSLTVSHRDYHLHMATRPKTDNATPKRRR